MEQKLFLVRNIICNVHEVFILLCFVLYTGLLDATTKSYTPHPKVQLLESIYDVKLRLHPFIEDLHGYTQPHSFKFVLNTSGNAEMFYRNWNHDPWSEEGLVLLKVY